MSWSGHKATYRCAEHPRLTARARRHQALEGRAPACPTCRRPMTLADPTDAAMAAQAIARRAPS